MPANRYKWHLAVFTEDEATQKVANGLARAFPESCNSIQVMPFAKGWADAVEQMENSSNLGRYSNRRVLLFIDFDEESRRPAELRGRAFFRRFSDRIFILGSFKEAEDLGKMLNLNDLEETGTVLGQNCSLWQDELLKDSLQEACRLKKELLEHQN